MSGTVLDFPGRRRGSDAAGDASAQQEERERHRREARERRLSRVPDLVDKLRRTHRADPSDRPLLARNLGRIIERMEKSGLQISERDLFERAFGAQAGEANYKKRKRFLRYEGEDTGPVRDGDYAANAANYLKLAHALADIATERQPDERRDIERRRLVLALIDRTSFDKRVDPQERLRGDAVGELLKRAQWLVDAVERQVDLDDLRARTTHNVAAALIDSEGNVARAVEPHTWSEESTDRERRLAHLKELEDYIDNTEDGEASKAWLNLALQTHVYDAIVCRGEHFDLGGPEEEYASWSHLSPRVVLGYVFTPVATTGRVIRMNLDIETIDAETESQRQSFENVRQAWGGETPFPGLFDASVARDQLLEKAAARTLAEAYGFQGAEVEVWSEVDALLQKSNYEPPRDPWHESTMSVLLRRRLELQLRFDPVTDRWCLCLALVRGVGSGLGAADVRGVFGMRRKGDNGGEIFENAEPIGMVDYPDDGSLFLCRSGEVEHTMFIIEDADAEAGDWLGMESGCLPLPGGAAIDALLTNVEHDNVELDPHFFEAALDDLWSRPAPAPHDTLAGKILRNLAYAPEDKRIDRLLIEDARRKNELIRTFAAAQRQEYDQAMARLDDERV